MIPRQGGELKSLEINLPFGLLTFTPSVNQVLQSTCYTNSRLPVTESNASQNRFLPIIPQSLTLPPEHASSSCKE